MTSHPDRSATDPAAPTWEEIAASLAGELDDERAVRVSAWLAAHSEDAALVSRVDGLGNRVAAESAHALDASVDVHAALAAVKSRRAERPLRVVEGTSPKTRVIGARPIPRRIFAVWQVAAAAVLVAGIGFYLTRAPADHEALVRLATGPGEVRTLTLADSSRIVVGPNSEVQIAAAFTAHRRVALRGDAWFSVTHDATRLFTVTSGDARITDLGTAFSVRTNLDGSVRVAVTDGVVRLQPIGATDSVALTLSRGEAGVVRNGVVTRLPDGVSPADTSWTGGQPILTDASIAEVTRAFHRWYGATLLVDLPDTARHLTATLPAASREQAALIVALSLGLRPHWSGDTVTLRSPGRP